MMLKAMQEELQGIRKEPRPQGAAGEQGRAVRSGQMHCRVSWT